jgi:hypothetical protein
MALFRSDHKETDMKIGVLGIFGDYESAELARTKLLESALPISRVALTAMQGPGQSRIATTPAARDKFLRTLRGLFKQGRDFSRAERLADRVERGAAVVSACAPHAEAAQRIAAVLKDCGASEIVRDAPKVQDAQHTGNHHTGNHEGAWPSYLWPAT